jgi:threonine dehydrogenase-like Zn-dependent dehydrogenase
MRFKTAAATAFAVRATAGIAPSARAQMMEAVQACRNGGTVVAMGYVDPTLEIPSYDIVIRQTQVVGTRALKRIKFREIVQLVNFGTCPTSASSSPSARSTRHSKSCGAGAIRREL